MTRWLRRARAALLTGLIWAVAWAPVGVLIGMVVDPDGSMDEPWMLVGTYPGFLGGVLFAVVLGLAARRRRLDELSLARVAAWGGLAGLLVGVLPFTIGEPTTDYPLWLLATVVIVPITLLGALSAAGSLALARMAERRGPRGEAVALANAGPSRLASDAERSEASPRLTAARLDELRRDRSDLAPPVGAGDGDVRRQAPPARP